MTTHITTDQNVKTTPEQPAQKLLAVASGKGGVGKTWFSISLCHALSQSGKKVLLFDGDLGLANVDVQLGMVAKHDINDVIEGHISMKNIIVRHAEGGFDVIAGRSGHGALATLPIPRLNEVLEHLRTVLKEYDAIIIDLGAGIDRTVRFLAAAADTTLVVSTDEPTSLTDAYAFIKLSNAAGNAHNIKIVSNMATNKKEGEATYQTLLKACKNFLKIEPPLAGIIRQDKRVKDSIRNQALFLLRYPTTETADDVRTIADMVAREILV